MPDVTGMRQVTPSRPDYWSGTRDAGSLWTIEQQAALVRERRHRGYPIRATLEVKLQVPNRQHWSLPDETITITCPVLVRSRCGTRAQVITPSGLKEWVGAV